MYLLKSKNIEWWNTERYQTAVQAIDAMTDWCNAYPHAIYYIVPEDENNPDPLAVTVSDEGASDDNYDADDLDEDDDLHGCSCDVCVAAREEF